MSILPTPSVHGHSDHLVLPLLDSRVPSFPHKKAVASHSHKRTTPFPLVSKPPFLLSSAKLVVSSRGFPPIATLVVSYLFLLTSRSC